MSGARRFRKRPVEVAAILNPHGLPAESDERREAADWCGGRIGGVGHIVIQTLEGEMRAAPGDWIIRGVAGEFYPCKPDIFEATYEPVGLRYIVRKQDDPEPAEHPEGGDSSDGWEVVDTTDDTLQSDWFTEADALTEAALLNGIATGSTGGSDRG